MHKLAIITARGGSKRIPRKNIKLFRGKPIIAYSIETAVKSGLFDYVMVSTDDDEIATIAVQYGAEVPFKRSPQTADDFSGTAEVLTEVIEELKRTGRSFEYACAIYPTAPFISAEKLEEAFELLKEKNYNSVFPVCAFSFPVQRSLELDDHNKIEMRWPENALKRSQDLPPSYHDAGQFYWLNTAQFGQEKKLYTSNSGAIVLNELEVQDIDNETDWKIAELKHSLLFPDL
ncbi:MAG: CMP-N-acetylneuraminic acid synthetase [Bacteroidetes bacterium]|jgi:N-acylneuraminate cytidylyltransferase|nr:CMP-N-acetylneuraminic acid synthetase [Bacteroidota bacterium]